MRTVIGIILFPLAMLVVAAMCVIPSEWRDEANAESDLEDAGDVE